MIFTRKIEKIDNDHHARDEFEIDKEVKQIDSMSATLYRSGITVCTTKIKERNFENKRSVENCIC